MSNRLKIASWNINSVRARPHLVEQLIADQQPDILCLQETKVLDAIFPAELFLKHGYRVIAHDRRGHGRSTQTGDGHDMDHYADDLAALTSHLDLKEAVHVGHSTGGGEVVHYLARHGEGRAAKAVIIGAVPPLMMKTAANPGGLPKEVFDGLQVQVAASRAQF